MIVVMWHSVVFFGIQRAVAVEEIQGLTSLQLLTHVVMRQLDLQII